MNMHIEKFEAELAQLLDIAQTSSATNNKHLAMVIRRDFLTLYQIRQLLMAMEDDESHLQAACDDILDEEKRLELIEQDRADAEPSDFQQHNTHSYAASGVKK